MTLYQAVFDRLSDNNKAVLLIDSINQEYVIDKHMLPLEAKPNDWLEIDIEHNQVVAIKLDRNKTIQAKQAIDEQVKRIRNTKKGSKFKRD